MEVKLKPDALKRYRDIAMLLMKYGNSDLMKSDVMKDAVDLKSETSSTVPAKAEELAGDLEKMGPAFIKIGQVLSTRPDFLPAAYTEALARLQDHCEPFSFLEVEQIIVSELGVRLSKAFKEFNAVPVAAASLGQIHHAIMRDGREVAVKVQRPGIRETILQDLDILGDIAEFYDHHTEAGKRYEFNRMLDEFRRTLLAELDYKKEASNLDTLSHNLREFERIKVPKPIHDFSSTKVLTMEFIRGKKITNISNLELLELDGEPLADECFKAYLKQILIDGFFHADPHPGNVLLTDDNKIGLLDLGMVARLTPQMQGKLLKLLLAISDNRPDVVADTAFDIGEPKPSFDEIKCRKQIADLVQDHATANVQDMQVGKVVLDITRSAADCGIRVPQELTMLGKTLLSLDQVGRTLFPDFNPNESVRNHAAEMMQQRVVKDITTGQIFTGIIEAKDFVEKFPRQVSKIFDMVAANSLSIKMIDEPLLVDAFQKLANRVSLALILASLIVGAALMMKVDTDFTIMGYPGIAIICFMLAAGGGFAMAIQIAFYDQKAQKFGSDEAKKNS